jgi:hypothetical protein
MTENINENNWYFVEESERIGPVNISVLIEKFNQKRITDDTYIWTKGMTDWKILQDLPDLKQKLQNSSTSNPMSPPLLIKEKIPDPIKVKKLSFLELPTSEKCLFIKIGADRGVSEIEYGPYSLDLLKKIFKENRINEKTYIFKPGMSNWLHLGEIEGFSEVFNTKLNKNFAEKRSNTRKPLIARIFMANGQEVFEGICRDISLGGMQVLMDKAPFSVNEKISLNVHPGEDKYQFTANGEIIRILEGKSGFSFRFSNLSSEAKMAIENYLNNN